MGLAPRSGRWLIMVVSVLVVWFTVHVVGSVVWFVPAGCLVSFIVVCGRWFRNVFVALVRSVSVRLCVVVMCLSDRLCLSFVV